ncbi:hypothetical protein KKA53_03735 [Candidatus Dependentiae bacterium]|nr:hypothetical protein [Candidatus Dependentiae bacterium]
MKKYTFIILAGLILAGSTAFGMKKTLREPDIDRYNTPPRRTVSQPQENGPTLQDFLDETLYKTILDSGNPNDVKEELVKTLLKAGANPYSVIREFSESSIGLLKRKHRNTFCRKLYKLIIGKPYIKNN